MNLLPLPLWERAGVRGEGDNRSLSPFIEGLG